jgi:hypothetical protein
MAYRVALALVVVAALGLVTACGGGGSGTRAKSNVPEFKPSVVQLGGAGVDPDQTPPESRDASSVVRRLGTDRFQLVVQNTSANGFINSFDWKGKGLTVTAVTRSSRGTCRVSGEMISCTQLSIPPPKCLCRPGGKVVIDFRAKYQAGDTKTLHYGVQDSAVWIGAMTLVPYIIPAHEGVNPSQADLPLCAKGQQSTSEQPCVHGN